MADRLIVTRSIPALPFRADNVHKGDVGRLMILGGCTGAITMIGAPALTANAAFRTGTGLVRILAPKELHGALANLTPESTFAPLSDDAGVILSHIERFAADILAVGPGMGESISSATMMDVLANFKGFAVLDADALRLLGAAHQTELPDPIRFILTPHTGEAEALLKSKDCNRGVADNPASRRATAIALHELFGTVVVLKGPGSVVTDGRRIFVNDTGNSGMATAGVGDVLTGVIAGLIGPGTKSSVKASGLAPYEAAVLGTHLHGLAGDVAAGEYGRRSVMAGDLVDCIIDAILEIQPEDEQ